MTAEQAIDVFRDGVGLAIRVGGPILLMCMAVGVLVALLQAMTQIHEQSIAFLLKVIVVVLYLSFGGGWVMASLQDFTRHLLQMIM